MRPMNLNVSSAAEACKVPRRDIEKARKEGRFPNAFYSGETQRGVWMIPLEGLISAGFKPDGGWLKKRQRRLAAIKEKGPSG